MSYLLRQVLVLILSCSLFMSLSTLVGTHIVFRLSACLSQSLSAQLLWKQQGRIWRNLVCKLFSSLCVNRRRRRCCKLLVGISKTNFNSLVLSITNKMKILGFYNPFFMLDCLVIFAIIPMLGHILCPTWFPRYYVCNHHF